MTAASLTQTASDERSPHRTLRRRQTAGLILLTLAALILRSMAMRQSLYGDELFTLDEVDRSNPLDVVKAIEEGPEVTPPLFFVLAWAAGKLGDPTIWIRLPSLIAGAALVPAVYFLGKRTLGRSAGALAAALLALAPYFLFYSSEARPYMFLALAVTGSALCLLKALTTGARSAWIAYALLTATAMYTHLSCVFVLAGQFLWATVAFPAQRRALLLATAGAALLYIPWLGNIGGKGNLLIYNIFFERPSSVAFKVFPGEPFVPLADLPGRAAILVAWLALAASVGWAVVAALRGREPRMQTVTLIWVLAIATPLGMGTASVITGYGLFTPRNLVASAPAFLLLVGWGVSRLPRPSALAAAAALVGVTVIGAAIHLQVESHRPAYRALSDDIQARMKPGDVVYDATPHPDEPALKPVAIYFDQPDDVIRPATDDRIGTPTRAFYIVARIGQFGRIPRTLGPRGALELTSVTEYPGFEELAVGQYAAHP